MVDTSFIRELTAQIVSAHVTKNSVPRGELSSLVESVANTLVALGAPALPEIPAPTPPVSVKKSVTPDYIISLEDGKQYKSLKRHLGVRGLTPDEYREKWGLPRDYPMVAPNYAAARSALAKSIGLGRKKAPEPAQIKRGRKRATRSRSVRRR